MHHCLGDRRARAFDLFHRALGIDSRGWRKGRTSHEKEKSALLFLVFPTFGMRLGYTSMLVAHGLRTGDGSKTKAQKYWKKLREDLEELYAFRNNLAHQPTTKDKIFPPDPDDEDANATIIWAEEIIPNKLDRERKFKPIEHTDLEAHLKSVSAIREKLENLYMHFSSLEERALEQMLRMWMKTKMMIE
jgi:hypothetical protein